jgi:hypothetical protein
MSKPGMVCREEQDRSIAAPVQQIDRDTRHGEALLNDGRSRIRTWDLFLIREAL